MGTVQINGCEYVAVAEEEESSCKGCVAFEASEDLCDSICESRPQSCLHARVIWVRKDSVKKQVELNQFFNQPMTRQMEMFPETLAVTKEEEEAWQTQQKSVARGVTDGTAGRDDPLSVQVGGGHYKSMAIQPVEYITKNNLPYCEANVIKYISRWRDKGGKKDLEKAKHYIDLLIQLENL